MKGTLTCTYIRYSRIVDPQLHSLLLASGVSPLKNYFPYSVVSLLLTRSYFPLLSVAHIKV